MSRTSAAAMALALAIIATVVSGCGKVDVVWQSSSSEPAAPVLAPEPGLANDQVVAATRASVVKTHGVANSCQKTLDGTGFVVAPHRVMTSAHGIAGADTISVEVDGNTLDAQAIAYDPNFDISLLDVPNLTSAPLTFAEQPAATGTEGVVLGYPAGGPFVATPARIRELVNIKGPDIYATTTVTRKVYTIRGNVKQGDSGGPLVSLDGHVLGMAFGTNTDDPETGYVLAASELAPLLQLVNAGNTAPVATGNCLG